MDLQFFPLPLPRPPSYDHWTWTLEPEQGSLSDVLYYTMVYGGSTLRFYMNNPSLGLSLRFGDMRDQALLYTSFGDIGVPGP